MNALGRHLLIELCDCDARVIESLDAVKRALVDAAHLARATIVDTVFHEFSPFGISGVVVIAESHLSIHTWPEYRYAAVDIFSCGSTLRPERAASLLVERLAAERVSIVEMQRGVRLGSVTPIATKRPMLAVELPVVDGAGRPQLSGDLGVRVPAAHDHSAVPEEASGRPPAS